MTPRDPVDLVGSQPAFKIVMRDQDRRLRSFLTKRLLNAQSAETIRGRATRVWEAIEIDELGKECGKPVVLKDTWVNLGRKNEGTIMEEIAITLRNKIAQGVFVQRTPTGDIDRGEQVIDILKDSTLTVICHGDVIGPSNDADMTRPVYETDKKFILRSQAGESQADRRSSLPDHLRTTTSSSSSLHRSRISSAASFARETGTTAFRYTQKIHYRIVFEELGTPLTEVSSVLDAFRALRHASHGTFLNLLCCVCLKYPSTVGVAPYRLDTSRCQRV